MPCARGELGLRRANLRHAQVVEAERRPVDGLLVPGKLGTGPGHVRPLREPLAPPRVILGNRMELRQVERDDARRSARRVGPDDRAGQGHAARHVPRRRSKGSPARAPSKLSSRMRSTISQGRNSSIISVTDEGRQRVHQAAGERAAPTNNRRPSLGCSSRDASTRGIADSPVSPSSKPGTPLRSGGVRSRHIVSAAVPSADSARSASAC